MTYTAPQAGFGCAFLVIIAIIVLALLYLLLPEPNPPKSPFGDPVSVGQTQTNTPGYGKTKSGVSPKKF